MKIVTIQPETFLDNVWISADKQLVEGRKLPYPFVISEDGKVQDQDFWKGDPSACLGFQRDEDVQQIDLWWSDAVQDPDNIVGMFPVFTQVGGPLYTYTVAIESVEVREVAAP